MKDVGLDIDTPDQIIREVNSSKELIRIDDLGKAVENINYEVERKAKMKQEI